MEPNSPASDGRSILYLAFADHARTSLADIGRLEEALACYVPRDALEGRLLIEMQSLDRVGQAIEDLVRMLEQLADRPSELQHSGKPWFGDVIAAAHLKTTRETMLRHLEPDAEGPTRQGLNKMQHGKSDTLGESPGSVDLF